MVFIFERKALCDGENFWNDIKLAIGYKGFLLHSLVTFLIGAGKDEWESSLPCSDLDSWAYKRGRLYPSFI